MMDTTKEPRLITNWCIPLDGATDVLRAGGKAATLARLRALGFLVPDGFVITTDAFAAACDASGIAADAASVDASQFTVPDALYQAMLAAYRQLGGGPVAVRSSAIAEDLAGASFAGQYDTLLNVEGDAALLDAVRRCWASAFGGRARAYAAADGQTTVGGMAVLVQRMVAAECAGVVFTQSPLAGQDGLLIIEAAPGLGDAVVSAQVTPDRYVVQRVPLLVRETVVSADRGPKAHPALDHATVRQLAATALRLEQRLGAPQDIEWAAVPGDIYLLQARPITTLAAKVDNVPPAATTVAEVAAPAPAPDAETHTGTPPAPELVPDAAPAPSHEPHYSPVLKPVPPGRPYDLWSRANVGEVFPGVISPLTWSAIQAGFRDFTAQMARGVGIPPEDVGDIFGLHYGRVYMNVGVVHHIVTEVLGFSSGYFEEALGGPGRVEGLPLPRHRVRWRKVARVVPGIVKDLWQSEDLPGQAARIIAQAQQAYRQHRAADVATMTIEELALLNRDLAEISGPGWVFHTQAAGTAFGAYGMLKGLLRRMFGDISLANDLLTGLATLETTRISTDLWQIARRAAADPALAAAIAAAPVAELTAVLAQTAGGQQVEDDLTTFLQQHGHRGHDELDVMVPRWVDDPQPILAVFKGYVAAGPDRDPALFADRQRLKREATERDIEQRLSQGVEALFPARRVVFRYLYERARALMPLRENIKHELLRLTLLQRRALREIGRRLTEQGILTEPEDIFFAEISELEAFVAAPRVAPVLKRRVMQRKRQQRVWLSLDPPEIIIPGTTPAPELHQPEAEPPAPLTRGTVLVGLGASGGRATGPARVLHSPAEADQMRPGDILVAPFTDPGWTPVFPLAAAIVMDLGGILSHGAIVAREYGIPAVVNVRNGTSHIRTGQTVTVNGTRGTVTVEGAAE